MTYTSIVSAAYRAEMAARPCNSSDKKSETAVVDKVDKLQNCVEKLTEQVSSLVMYVNMGEKVAKPRSQRPTSYNWGASQNVNKSNSRDVRQKPKHTYFNLRERFSEKAKQKK